MPVYEPQGKYTIYGYQPYDSEDYPKFESRYESKFESPRVQVSPQLGLEDSYATSAPHESAYRDIPVQEVRHHRKDSIKTNICWLLSLIIGLAWLGPGIYLLYINFANQVIGASAWCPGGQCHVISYEYWRNDTTAVRAVKADDDNHDLLGGLQLVAKILEIWFVGIAASLLYTLSRMLAQRPGGLPVGYLLSHLEFADLRYLFTPTLWTSINPRTSESMQSLRPNKHKHALMAFMALALVMCITSNLTGPSIAVLMIPTLNWVDTPKHAVARFTEVLSSSQPSSGFTEIPGCDAASLEAGHYNCSSVDGTDRSADSMDALVEAVMSSASMNLNAMNAKESNATVGVSAQTMEDLIPFSFNFSDYSKESYYSRLYTPSRQVVRTLNEDFRKFSSVVLGESDDAEYAQYNNSLGIQLQRNGPSLGTDYSSYLGNRTVIQLGDEKHINCFLLTGSTNVVEAPSSSEDAWTKCYRYGQGWNETSSYVEFTVGQFQGSSDSNPENLETQLGVNTYWSDRFGYIKGDERAACLSQFFNDIQFQDLNPWNFTKRASCDWDEIFSRELPSGVGLVPDRRDGFVTEWRAPWLSNITTLVIEQHPFTANALYSLDATEAYPTLPQVTTPLIDTNSLRHVVLHPDWLLLALGLQNGSDIWWRQPTGVEAMLAMYNLLSAVIYLERGYEISDETMQRLMLSAVKMDLVSMVLSLQTLSYVTFDATELPPSMSVDDQDPDIFHPVLWRNVRRQVWKYGLDSRTAKLGVTVVILACLTVVLRTVLVLFSGTRNPGTVEFVISALEHNPKRQFSGATTEKEAAKVRYRVQYSAGDERLRFNPV